MRRGSKRYSDDDLVQPMIDFRPFELGFSAVLHQFGVRTGIADG